MHGMTVMTVISPLVLSELATAKSQNFECRFMFASPQFLALRMIQFLIIMSSFLEKTRGFCFVIDVKQNLRRDSQNLVLDFVPFSGDFSVISNLIQLGRMKFSILSFHGFITIFATCLKYVLP